MVFVIPLWSFLLTAGLRSQPLSRVQPEPVVVRVAAHAVKARCRMRHVSTAKGRSLCVATDEGPPQFHIPEVYRLRHPSGLPPPHVIYFADLGGVHATICILRMEAEAPCQPQDKAEADFLSEGRVRGAVECGRVRSWTGAQFRIPDEFRTGDKEDLLKFVATKFASLEEHSDFSGPRQLIITHTLPHLKRTGEETREGTGVNIYAKTPATVHQLLRGVLDLDDKNMDVKDLLDLAVMHMMKLRGGLHRLKPVAWPSCA